MQDTLEKTITDLKIDRSGWELVKFKDVAIQQKKSVDRENTELTKYVKGEHMGSEDLHLREWGDLKDEYLGPAFIRKFEPGDILYGSRRTYLRKVAIAHFEGITSNTTFVIKANEKRIDKRLLPFVMLSEGFAKHSIRNSKGSVNPYVNWKDLANYEFLLPPKEQQAPLAELLWAMDEVIEREYDLERSLKKFYEALRENLLNVNVNGLKVKLGEVSKLQGGATFKSMDATDHGIKWLKIANVGFNEIKWDEKSYLPESFKEKYSEYVLSEGDIVMALTRPILGDKLKVAKIKSDDSDSLLNQRVGRVLTNGNINIDYLFEHLNSYSFLLAMKRELQGTDPPNISNKMYENYSITLPNQTQQTTISYKLRSVSATLESIQKKVYNSRSLQKSLINQIF